MKFIILIIHFVVIINFVTKAQNNADSYDYFIGINPIAPLTSLPNQFTNLYLPLFSNLETGLAVNTGIKLKKSVIEGRLSYGKPNTLFKLSQIHLGYCYFINRKDKNTGFYIGGFTKYYHLKNTKNDIRNSSIIPYLCAGYRLEKQNIFIDFRLNQNVYAISWSNQEHTSINSNFHFSVYDDISPVLPYLSINIGYVFHIAR
jgi:hypothetical protein